ncbi:MAG: hypothetical protein AAGD25_17360 [Cyanobacteria bacterium P01_F01_bin.150]
MRKDQSLMGNGDTIDARASENFVNRAQSVDMQDGDRTSIDTGGGDVTQEGDVDKRQGIFINLILGANITGQESQQGIAALQTLLSQILKPIQKDHIESAYFSAFPKDDSFITEATTQTDRINVLELQKFNKLQDFFFSLVQNPAIPESERERLKFELKNAGLFDETSQAAFETAQPKLVAPQKTPYLLIVLEPSGSDTFLTNGWVFTPGDSKPVSASQFKPLDLADEKKGTACSFDDISQTVDQFLSLIKRKRGHYLKGYKLKQLTVEVFLPAKYFSKAIEYLWQTKRQGEEIPLCVSYPMALRFYERLGFDEYLYDCWDDWVEGWQKLEKLCVGKPTFDVIDELKELTDCNWSKIGFDLKKHTEKVGFLLPLVPLDEDIQETLFRNLALKTVAPMAIWFRRPLEELNQNELITFLKETQPHRLPFMIRELREQLHNNQSDNNQDIQPHFAQYWSILWENPNRLPPDILLEVQDW